MKKELGKWFLDIAKYLLTAVVIGSLVNDYQDTRWLVYVTGGLLTLVMFTIGLAFIYQHTKNERS